MRAARGTAVGGLGPSQGSRRAGHRFVVVVYGDAAASADATIQPWPGHVVHVPNAIEAAPEIRVSFDEVERLPVLIRGLIREAHVAPSDPPRMSHPSRR